MNLASHSFRPPAPAPPPNQLPEEALALDPCTSLMNLHSNIRKLSHDAPSSFQVGRYVTMKRPGVLFACLVPPKQAGGSNR